MGCCGNRKEGRFYSLPTESWEGFSEITLAETLKDEEEPARLTGKAEPLKK